MSEYNPDPDANITPLQAEVGDRFGILPNFFRLTPETPEIMENLWRFAEFGYLDNPLPPLFKERLFVYLSRFCDVRYCIARHVGFLVGLGRPAGDRQCGPETVEQVLRLIRRPLPRGEALEPYLVMLETGAAPLPSLPVSDAPAEQAVFACATHVFLQTPQAMRCLEALRRALGEVRFQHLTVLLAFVRTAHFWTKVHPEIGYEDDVRELLATHETLAGCVLNDTDTVPSEIDQVLFDELISLRRERALREDLETANQALRETEERLRQRDRHKDEFLATLAHELRNPLAPIRFGLQILKFAPADDKTKTADTWAMLERQLARMVRLVDDLLDVNRISLGKIELRRERMELVAVAKEAVEAVRPLCDDMNHELTLTLPAQPVYLNADPARLAQAVGNLLTNACKFTARGGRIWLTVELTGRESDRPEAVIRVRDTGVGIAPDQLAGVFDLFTQVDISLERAHGGLGVGLALVKRLIEMHNGTVTAYSAGLGQGSEFRVHLPALSEPFAAPSPERPGDSSAAVPRRILVVDDNRDSADSLALLLRLSGHQVDTAQDGLEAVATAAQLQPEVILLDIGLPRLNGYDAAQQIRQQRGKDVILVALTGWGQEEDRRRTAQAGFDAHLVKPVDYAELTRLLAGLSAGREPFQEPVGLR